MTTVNGYEIKPYADLQYANLRYADLPRGCYRLQGRFEATIYPDGRLAFGCVCHPFAYWRSHIYELAREHAPGNVGRFVRETRAILTFAEAIQ